MGCGCGQSIRPTCNKQSTVVDFCCLRNDERDVDFVDISVMLPRVTLVAQGVSDSIAIEYLRKAAYILARESRLLERTARITLQKSVVDYYLENGSEQITLLKSIRLDDKCCHVRKCFEPFNLCNGFKFYPPDKIVLDELPKEDGGTLEVIYYAAPTQDSCEIDRLLYDQYHDTIVNGAIADLLLMSKYDFSDYRLAVVYEQKFRRGIASAKIDVARDFVAGTNNEHPSKYWRKI